MKTKFLILISIFMALFFSSQLYSATGDAVRTRKNNTRVMPASKKQAFQQPRMQVTTRQEAETIILGLLDEPTRKIRAVDKVLKFFKGEVAKDDAAAVAAYFLSHNTTSEENQTLVSVLETRPAEEAADILGREVKYNDPQGGTTLDDLGKVFAAVDVQKLAAIFNHLVDINLPLVRMALPIDRGTAALNDRGIAILQAMDPAKADKLKGSF